VHASVGVAVVVHDRHQPPPLAISDKSASAPKYVKYSTYSTEGTAAGDHTWTTAIRCSLGRSGSSTSLLMSSGSLVSSTTGRASSKAVAATSASIAHLCPDNPAVPSSSPARRPSSGLTGCTVIRDRTRWTGASRGPPLSTSVKVMALTMARAPRSHAVSRKARTLWSPAESLTSPSLSKTSAPPAAATARLATNSSPRPVLRQRSAHTPPGGAPRVPQGDPTRVAWRQPRSRTD
jgi:hypothetical protein